MAGDPLPKQAKDSSSGAHPGLLAPLSCAALPSCPCRWRWLSSRPAGITSQRMRGPAAAAGAAMAVRIQPPPPEGFEIVGSTGQFCLLACGSLLLY